MLDESPSALIDRKIAALPDPTGPFNSSLNGAVRRAIDIHEGQPPDAEAFRALIRAAAAANGKKG